MRDIQEFDSIMIRLASPDMIKNWSYGEVKKTGDDKLPYTASRKRRSVLRTDFWHNQGMGVLLRQV